MRQPDSKFQYIQYTPTDICLLVPHIWKSGGTKIFFSLAPLANPVFYPGVPHLKIRGAAHGYNYDSTSDSTGVRLPIKGH